MKFLFGLLVLVVLFSGCCHKCHCCHCDHKCCPNHDKCEK